MLFDCLYIELGFLILFVTAIFSVFSIAVISTDAIGTVFFSLNFVAMY